MNTRRLMLAIVAVVVAAGLVATVATAQADKGEKITISKTYKPGKYVMTMNMDMDQEIEMGQPKPMQTKVQMMFVVGLEAGRCTDAGDQDISFVYRRMKMDLAGPVKMTYDSDDKESSGPLGEIMGAIIGQKISATIGADGTVKNVKGLDEMLDKMAKSNPQMTQTAEQMKKQIGGMMQQFGQFVISPGKPVAVGDDWKIQKQMDMPVLGAATVDIQYTLKGLEKPKVAVIAMSGSFKKDKGGTVKVGNQEAKIGAFQFDQAGTLKVNYADLIPMSMEGTQKGIMEMTVGGGADAPGVTMKIKQDGKFSMTIQADDGTSKPAPKAVKTE